MTRYYVIYLDKEGNRINMDWTYNKSEIKGLCKEGKRMQRIAGIAGVKVGNSIWMF